MHFWFLLDNAHLYLFHNTHLVPKSIVVTTTTSTSPLGFSESDVFFANGYLRLKSKYCQFVAKLYVSRPHCPYASCSFAMLMFFSMRYTARDPVQQHQLCNKKNNLEVIFRCLNGRVVHAKECFGRESFRVYHCAGVRADAVLATLDQESFRHVIRRASKTYGTDSSPGSIGNMHTP